jgi:FLYWCH zinc finger domain
MKLFVDGYDYTKAYEANASSKWVCATKNTTKCKARLRLDTLERRVVMLNLAHNHDMRQFKKGVKTMDFDEYLAKHEPKAKKFKRRSFV